jgi:hypothetical protein
MFPVLVYQDTVVVASAGTNAQGYLFVYRYFGGR